MIAGYFVLTIDNDKLVCVPDFENEEEGPEYFIRFSGILARQLGFADDTDFMTGTIKSPSPVNVDLGLPFQFCVTSNIVKNQMFGDRVTQLLRSCTIELNKYVHGGVYKFQFYCKQYIPVSTSDLHEIKIDIVNFEAKNLPFLSGTSVVVLHFRRCENS